MAPVRIYTVEEVTEQSVEELRSRFLEEVQKEDVRGKPGFVPTGCPGSTYLNRVLGNCNIIFKKYKKQEE